jgi:hypothetical protein
MLARQQQQQHHHHNNNNNCSSTGNLTWPTSSCSRSCQSLLLLASITCWSLLQALMKGSRETPSACG